MQSNRNMTYKDRKESIYFYEVERRKGEKGSLPPLPPRTPIPLSLQKEGKKKKTIVDKR